MLQSSIEELESCKKQDSPNDLLDILGQSCILLSTLEDDEDLALEVYERGIEVLKVLAKREDASDRIKRQIEMLQEDNEDDEDDETSNKNDQTKQ